MRPDPRRRELWAAAITLVVASFVYRLPSLANAEGTNADAAVVGLQAMHLLRGEHAAFLWGSGYQTAADSYVAAAWFAVLGPTGLALRLSTLVEHVVLTLAVFGVLTRRFRPALGGAARVGPGVHAGRDAHVHPLRPAAALADAFVRGVVARRRGGFRGAGRDVAPRGRGGARDAGLCG